MSNWPIDTHHLEVLVREPDVQSIRPRTAPAFDGRARLATVTVVGRTEARVEANRRDLLDRHAGDGR